jgi:hypothetical protein
MAGPAGIVHSAVAGILVHGFYLGDEACPVRLDRAG